MKVRRDAVAPFFKNGYLVSCETMRRGVLIDPGDEVDTLIDAARTGRVDVQAILLTHAHVDHVTGVGRAKEVFEVPIWLDRADLPLYDNAVDQARMFGFEVEPPPPVDRFYDPATPLEFGRYRIDVLRTPGHSPGGVCLAIGPAEVEDRELFVGDTLFAGSIGRTDLPGGDYATLIQSIRDVLFRFPDETIVHSGHGPDTTIGEERRTNPFLNAAT